MDRNRKVSEENVRTSKIHDLIVALDFRTDEPAQALTDFLERLRLAATSG